MRLALTMLCENPARKTGLTTLYHEFVKHSLRLYPDIEWVVFVGPKQEWTIQHTNLQVIRDFPANDQLRARLFADHFLVPASARNLGADALLTTGFVPVRKSLPVVMHALSLQHLDPTNRSGLARQIYRTWVMRRSWPKADLVITNSRFAVGQILSVLPSLKDRLVQSYEGLQHEQFHTTPEPREPDQLRAALDLQPGYFLWLSNFYPYKQAPLLIEAYALLDAATRRRHPLVMVGGDWQNQLAAAKAQVERLGIADTVRFLGWIDDKWLAPLYRQAAAFCMASREETFGRSVIEAMACGTPCIVNDIPIMHEVTDGRAILIDFNDRQRVATAMRDLVDNTTARERLREEGVTRAKSFNFERLATERITAIRNWFSNGRLTN
jgi:glycosyltransferase involved in cell wall biosynthesis